MRFAIRSSFVLLLFGLMTVGSATAAEETRQLTLPPVDSQPLPLVIPIRASKPGLISASFKLQASEWQGDRMVFVSLNRKGDESPFAAKYYDPRKLGLYLSHELTVDELAAGQDFTLSLINYSRDVTVSGEVKIAYPVAGEKQLIVGEGPLPNLAVTDLRLDKQCKVEVVLKNLGPGPVPVWAWKRNPPELVLYRDDEEWGRVDIRYFDYAQALLPVGGEAVYRPGLRVIGSNRIMAVVDAGGVLREADESDNARADELICK